MSAQRQARRNPRSSPRKTTTFCTSSSSRTPAIDPQEAGAVELHFDGTGTLAYQVVGRYFIPWEEKRATEPLSIDVAYDRTRLAQNDIATATATIRNNLPKTANMVMVDLGIPPGFELLSEDLQSLQEKTRGQKSGRLEKFSLTATQAILYFNAIAPADTRPSSFRLRAKYPIRAHTSRRASTSTTIPPCPPRHVRSSWKSRSRNEAVTLTDGPRMRSGSRECFVFWKPLDSQGRDSGGRGRNRTYNLSVKRGIIKHGTSMLSMEWGGAERSKWSLLGTQFGEEFGEELRLN